MPWTQQKNISNTLTGKDGNYLICLRVHGFLRYGHHPDLRKHLVHLSQTVKYLLLLSYYHPLLLKVYIVDDAIPYKDHFGVIVVYFVIKYLFCPVHDSFTTGKHSINVVSRVVPQG